MLKFRQQSAAQSARNRNVNARDSPMNLFVKRVHLMFDAKPRGVNVSQNDLIQSLYVFAYQQQYERFALL